MMASENTSNKAPEQIDISDILYRFMKILKRTWVLVVLASLLFGVYKAYKAKQNYVPIYEATAFFSVDSGYSESDIFYSNYYDSKAADQLAQAFPHMLSTGIMTDIMMDYLGKDYINGTISATSVANTGMFVMSVRSTSPKDAYDVLWAVIDCYPQVAVYMVNDPQIILREEPVMPTEPSNPFSYKLPFIKGAVTGAVAVLAVILLCSFAVKKITDAEQLKHTFNCPVISVLPYIRIKKRRKADEGFLMSAMDTGLSESFKGMSHKIQRKLAESGNNTVLVTSTTKNEGKTTVAANLASSMAKSGYRVIILDADLRNQSISERFSAEKSQVGLLQLMNDAKFEVMSAVRRVGDTNIFYISSESVKDNRYSIDHSGFTRVLSVLKSEFDYVIIDTPPCGLVADAGVLSNYADYVLYVVRSDFASKTRIVDSVNSLYDRGGSVAGFIFNGADIKSRSYGYGYKYGYGYSYKYGYGYGGTYGYGDNKSDNKS